METRKDHQKRLLTLARVFGPQAVAQISQQPVIRNTK